jgi:predicted Fe-Mo cluster-binding NifX family protein
MLIKVAVASSGQEGLESIVSDVFGRSPFFVLIGIERGKIRKVTSMRNDAAERQHGAGPLICTKLSRLGVDVAIGSNFGPTVSDILREAGIQSMLVSPGVKVKDAVGYFIKARRRQAKGKMTKLATR